MLCQQYTSSNLSLWLAVEENKLFVKTKKTHKTLMVKIDIAEDVLPLMIADLILDSSNIVLMLCTVFLLIIINIFAENT